jgi:hypothetical protein
LADVLDTVYTGGDDNAKPANCAWPDCSFPNIKGGCCGWAENRPHYYESVPGGLSLKRRYIDELRPEPAPETRRPAPEELRGPRCSIPQIYGENDPAPDYETIPAKLLVVHNPLREEPEDRGCDAAGWPHVIGDRDRG